MLLELSLYIYEEGVSVTKALSGISMQFVRCFSCCLPQRLFIYFVQAIYRKIQDEGLLTNYRDVESNVRNGIRQILSLISREKGTNCVIQDRINIS